MVHALLLSLLLLAQGQPTTGVPFAWFVDLTDTNYEQVLLKHDGAVYVLFYMANACEPCVQQDVQLKEVMAEFAGRVLFTRTDVRAAEKVTKAATIRGVPTHFILKPREATGSVAEGLLNAAQLRTFLLEGLALNPKPGPAVARETIARASSPDQFTLLGVPAVPFQPGVKRPMVPVPSKR